jgi:hypothetical protein
MKKLMICIAGIGLAMATVQAGHARVTPEEQARSLAFELQDRTWDLLDKAERHLRYGSYRNEHALENLQRLKIEATRLSRKFDRNPFNNYGIDRQLQRTDRAIERAIRSTSRIRGKGFLRNRLRGIENTFSDLLEARSVMLARYERRHPHNRVNVSYRRNGVRIDADIGGLLEKAVNRHRDRAYRIADHID